jgi:maltose alpha-D-glucosyltransferase / alpha-amylase
VVNHLSSEAQAVELDLRRVNIRIEMFGKNIFPRVGEVPYLLTLGPYHFLLVSVAKNLK